MSLLPCAGCDHDVSGRAAACRHCGHPVPPEAGTPETEARLTDPDPYTCWLLPVAWLIALGATLDTGLRGTGPFTAMPVVIALAVVVRVARAQRAFAPLAVFCVVTWVLSDLAQVGLPFLLSDRRACPVYALLDVPQLPVVLTGAAVLLALAATRFGARAITGGRFLTDDDAHPGLIGFLVVGAPVMLLLAAGASVGDHYFAWGTWRQDGLWEASVDSFERRAIGPTSSLVAQLALGSTAIGLALAGVGLGIDRTVSEVRGRLGLSGDPTRSLLIGATVGLVFGCLFSYLHRQPPGGEAPTYLLGLCAAQVGGELLLRGALQPATGAFWPAALGCSAALLHGDPRLLGAMALWQVLMAVVRHFSGVPAVLVAPLTAGGLISIVWRVTEGAASQGGMP